MPKIRRDGPRPVTHAVPSDAWVRQVDTDLVRSGGGRSDANDRTPGGVQGHAADLPAIDPLGRQEAPVEIPAGNASTSAWRAFVAAQNPPFDVETRTRDELRGWFHGVHGGGDVDHNGDSLVIGDGDEASVG